LAIDIDTRTRTTSSRRRPVPNFLALRADA
jgi:hypothetical protein